VFALFASAVLAVAVAVVVGLFMPNPFMRGLVLGAAIVGAPGAVWVIAMQLTGTAPTMMGDQAEQWTAQELRRLSRRGWRLVNHFALRADDIDHVLIGPGGAIALETKWSASTWHSDYGRQRLRDAVTQVKANARTLRLWHPLKSREVPVTPVVVLWGRGLSKWPDSERVRHIDDVVVVIGPALRHWLESLDETALPNSRIDEVWPALDEQVERRDPLDAKAHPIPTSLTDWAMAASAAVCLGVVGVMLFGRLLAWTPSWWAAVAMALPTAGLGMIAVRTSSVPAVTWAGRAWTIALLTLSFALTLAELAYQL